MLEILQTEFWPAFPLLLVGLGAIFAVLFEALLPRHLRGIFQFGWTAIILAVALGWTIYNWMTDVYAVVAMGSLTLDGPTWLLWTMLLVFGFGALLLISERRAGGGDSAFTASASAVPGSQADREALAAHREHTEIFALLMFSLFGMMTFVSASDFITMFIGLEVLSFPLYIMCGMARRRRLLSHEAAMKYFLLGALSSAIFLYGFALLYGYSGSFEFATLDTAILLHSQSEWLLLAGLSMVSIGVLFKVGVVPFHSWVPDVYGGAPTPVTAFMAVCTKIAAIGGLARVLYVALGAMAWTWQLVLAVLAVLTMLIAGLVGLTQDNVKRMLAYSSINHAGFLIMGLLGAVVATGDRTGSLGSVLFYLIAYGFATLGAFGLVSIVQRGGQEATGFSSWQGLGRTNPVLAALMTLFLLSMAGIPLTGGFIGKLLVFVSAWQGGYRWLVFVAIIASLIAAGFYFKLLWVMYGKEPEDGEVVVVNPGVGTHLVVWIGALMTLVLGVFPGPTIDLINQAAGFLRIG